MAKKKLTICIFGAVLVVIAAIITLVMLNRFSRTDYSVSDNWAYLETAADGKAADIFFICPTVYGGTADSFNMPLDDAETKAAFVGAINMEKGIYDDNARFFAPYYRQIGLNAYSLPVSEREKYLETAYADVKLAFDYYMHHFNKGRPIILAGFSQGAELCLRLMKEFFGREEYSGLLVACYAVGWSVTEEEAAEYPQLAMAERADDTGVVIAFNSEAEGTRDSLMIPEGTRTLAVNPLNWRSDSEPADRTQNLGACFTDYGGNIVNEIPELTGAYIDPERGSLIVTDVTPEEYPPVLDIFESGVYHLYDYQFFYRDLEKNVQDRIAAFIGEAA